MIEPLLKPSESQMIEITLEDCLYRVRTAKAGHLVIDRVVTRKDLQKPYLKRVQSNGPNWHRVAALAKGRKISYRRAKELAALPGLSAAGQAWHDFRKDMM